MKRILSGLFTVLLIASPSGQAFAQTPQVSPSLQRILDVRVAGTPGSGIVVGVIDHGQQTIYIAGGSGNARALDDRTLFEIGSDTKTFTATILALMVQDGELRLNDPIAKYLPRGVRVPSKDTKTITLLNLAEQRSGLPRMPTNMTNAVGDDPFANYDVIDMYAFLNGYTLPRDPGSTYEYSNYGIGLLGQVLADRAKSSYADLLRARVLVPLGMTDTTLATMPANDPIELAVGHDLGNDPVPPWHFGSIAPAGGIRSDVTDMLKYLRCNMGQGPLAKACLFAQQPRADGEVAHKIGLVWWTNPITGIVSHGGDTGGYHAFVGMSKDRQTGVVVMSNGPAVTDIAAHVLAPSYPVAACPTSVPAQLDLSTYAGVYCVRGAGITFYVAPSSSAAEQLIALDTQPALPYERVAPETFQESAVGAAVIFVRHEKTVVGFTFVQNGTTLEAIRLNADGSLVVPQLRTFPPVVALEPSALQSYVGTYRVGSLGFTVTVRGNELYVQLIGQPTNLVYASAKDEFFYRDVDAQITFGRDAAGSVSTLTLHQNGQNITATRTSPI